VQKYLTEKGIPWTIWDYTGGFGLFKKGSNELFDYDLNIELLQSLGFTVPVQKPFTIKADSVGFPIYSDYIETKIQEAGSSGGAVDFYNTSKPNNGKNCIYWSNAPQYNSIGFDFKPDKDLSKLNVENYALDFMVRGNSPGAKFDIRFIDSKTSEPADHPWRMRKTIDNSFGARDRKWHHVHIPLSTFAEQGSWDNGAWIEPQGKFDWKAIDRFEIVAEQEALTGKEFWFDNIHITNLDTAAIRDTSFLSHTAKIKTVEHGEIKVYPNPMNQNATIEYTLFSESQVEINLYNQTGVKVVSFANQKQSPGKYTINWIGKDNAGNYLPNGLYILSLNASGILLNRKIVVNYCP
jgi:endoglucanase